MDTFHSKVLIFGEYSLLYNSKALTMPLHQFKGKLNFSKSGQASKSSNASLRAFCRHIIKNHFPIDDQGNVINVQRFQLELDKGLYFESNIPQGFGLGSSGAIVAAIFMRYIDRAGEMKDLVKAETKENINKLKGILSSMEAYFHGTSSGIDPLSILLNKPLLYNNAKDVVPVDLPAEKAESEHVLFLLNTEIARNTGALVKRFKDSCENPTFKQVMEENLVAGNNACIESFLNADYDNLYRNLQLVCNFQFEHMNYLIPENLQGIMKNGLDSGDYFMKICGSGGGGFMLGFTADWEKTKAQLSDYPVEVIYRY
jgi:mevalonate kinase